MEEGCYEAAGMFKPTKLTLEQKLEKHKHKMELLRSLIGVLVVVMQSIILHHIIIK